MSQWNIEHIYQSIEEWLRIKRFHDLTAATKSNEFTYVDASHSALLRRILDQQKVYKLPPPTSMSYPWYDLLDNGKAACSFRIDENEKKISVNQNGYQWELMEIVHPGRVYKIRCTRNNMICLVTIRDDQSNPLENADIVVLELHDGKLSQEKRNAD